MPAKTSSFSLVVLILFSALPLFLGFHSLGIPHSQHYFCEATPTPDVVFPLRLSFEHLFLRPHRPLVLALFRSLPPLWPPEEEACSLQLSSRLPTSDLDAGYQC